MKKTTTASGQKQKRINVVRILTLSMMSLLLLSSITACSTSAKSQNYLSETMAVSMDHGALEDASSETYVSAGGANRAAFSASALSSDEAEAKSTSLESGTSENAEAKLNPDSLSADRKLIRTVDLSFETTDFDQFTKDIEAKVTSLGGYVESSDLSGTDATARRRNAYYTLRIPKPQVDAFLSFAEGEANLTRKYESTQDISLQYYDTESRKKALQSEYDRLMELMAQAESVDAVIAIEQRLSDIRYQLDSYESDLRRYDNQVDYSTVTVNVSETTVLTASEGSGFWSRVQANLEQNLEDLCDAAIGLLIWFLSSLPILLALGVLLFIAYRIVKALRAHWKKQKDGKIKAAATENPTSSEVEPPTPKL